MIKVKEWREKKGLRRIEEMENIEGIFVEPATSSETHGKSF